MSSKTKVEYSYSIGCPVIYFYTVYLLCKMCCNSDFNFIDCHTVVNVIAVKVSYPACYVYVYTPQSYAPTRA